MRRYSSRGVLVFALAFGMLAAIVATGAAPIVPDVVAANPNCSGLIVNGGFEQGTPGSGANATGWTGSYWLTNAGDQHSGSQYVYLTESYPTISQVLITTGLPAGTIITVTFYQDSGIHGTLGTTSQDFPSHGAYNYGQETISYTLVTATPSVALTFTNIDLPFLDDVSATCVGPTPTPTNTPTVTPTNTPTATPTNTP
ncbi:MAG TPA: hypothetical protein VFQ54_06235, partial [Thermomicrobiales bacterium]|nr:hypothetical protein [Thermomicrobiales bacterium]